MDKLVVSRFAHRGIEIDQMQPPVFLKLIEQAEDVRDCQFSPPSTYKLHRLASLQIDAGDQHGSRTSMPCAARNFFNSRIDWTPSWKMDAARAASADPSVKIWAKC